VPRIVARRLGGQRGPQLRRATLPGGQHELGIGGTVVLAERAGQVPRVQMPLGAGRARHRAHRDLGSAVAMVRQVPGRRQPASVGAGRVGERRDVLGSGRVRQRGQFGGVLPGQLAGQRVRGHVGGQQPGQPAGRRVVEVLVVVVRHAPQMAGQVHRPPLRTRRRGQPRRVCELARQFTDHGHAVAVGGQDARPREAAHGRPGRVMLLRFTVPLPAGSTGPVTPGNRLAKLPGEPACQSYAPRTSRTPQEKSGDNLSPGRLTSR
jgi:hypothetical protein